MTEAERVAKGQRAQQFMDEFLEPALVDIGAEYMDRLVDVTSEFDGAKRHSKQDGLTYALRVLRQVEVHIRAHIRDGDVAMRETVRFEHVEQMTKPKRRLLGIAPY